MPSFDVILIGGGTNGLAAAHRLQTAGRRVLVLEAAPVAGGGAAAWEFAQGYRAPGLAHLVNMLDPRVERGMDLGRHGLSHVSDCLASTAVARDGRHLVLAGAAGETVSGLAPGEAEAWQALRDRLMTFAGVLAPFKEITPPRIAAGAGNDHLRLARLGLGIRAMGRENFREFLRVILINVHDVLNETLTDPRLKGHLAHDAVLGTWLGPRSPNSLIHLLNRFAGQVGGRRGALALPRGGMGAVAEAMVGAATAAGVTLRTKARVARLIVEADRAAGVVLETGEEIRADTLVSAIGVRETFLSLLGARHLDTGFVNRVRHMKVRGGAARLHLALTGTPDFRGADLRSRLVLAPDEEAVELAFNPVKYGEVPARPVMEVVLPSAHEDGHAPGGHHVLSAVVQFAPHAPKAGADAARAAMLETTLSVLEDHAPGIRRMVAHAEMLMPYDIEARHGLAGGNWHHGELSVEQMLFLRPFPGMSQYRTPVAGLWLAGAGCHPGGGISGAAGWNAADRIIREAGA